MMRGVDHCGHALLPIGDPLLDPPLLASVEAVPDMTQTCQPSLGANSTKGYSMGLEACCCLTQPNDAQAPAGRCDGARPAVAPDGEGERDHRELLRVLGPARYGDHVARELELVFAAVGCPLDTRDIDLLVRAQVAALG